MLDTRIQEIIKEVQMKQKDFAESIGVSESYISMLLGGKKDTLSMSLAMLIQEKYGYRAEWVLGGVGDKRIDDKRTVYQKLMHKRIESLPDAEIKALLIYSNSLADIMQVLGNSEELIIAGEEEEGLKKRGA